MSAHLGSNSLKLSFLFSCIFATYVFAQGDGDPPTRVARLNLMQGAVSMQPAGADEWVPGVINRPFTTGDYLFADTGSRAELHLDTAVIRMSEQTSFGFLNLGDQVAQLQLSEGKLQTHLRRLNGDDVFEVDTPNAAITLLREGDYTFTVDPDNGTTFLVIRQGEAEITGGGQAFTLHANQSVQLSGTDQLGYDVENAPGADDFENYCLQRDQREAHLQATRYVPADMIGYEDLDDNGSWRNTPEYGNVWYPRNVPVDWAPYHDGHWAWVDPWGWTWVDDMQWGFAPFHYGRWAYVGGAWGWTPGPSAVVAVGRPVVRPVYAPALVAFIGGANWGVSIGVGGGGPRMGWVPLGPGELYSPAYHVSQNYYHHVNGANTVINKNVNITNVYNTTYVHKTVVNNTTVINNQTYANMRAPNAVMTMPQNAFASGQAANRVGQPVPAQAVGRIHMNSAAVLAPPVAPTKQALTAGFSAGQKPVAHPPAQLMSRPVVAKVAPPPAPVSFAAQQQVLQRNAGQVFNAKAVRTEAPPAAVKPAAQVKIANQGQTVTKTNAVVGQKVGPPVAPPNAARPTVANTPNVVANQPTTNLPNNPANQHGVPPNRRPNTMERPVNPAPNVNPNAAQPVVRTNPNAVVNQPPAAVPNNTVNPATNLQGNPANQHGVPPNRQPNNMERPVNPAPNVNPNSAQPVVRTNPNAVVNQPSAAVPNNTVNPANNPQSNPGNQHGVPPNRQPNTMERPVNPAPNVNPNAAQPVVRTNPNAVVNQPPAAVPNNTVNPANNLQGNPANQHGVPPNRQPNNMERPVNPAPNVNPNSAQPVVRTNPNAVVNQPPAEVPNNTVNPANNPQGNPGNQHGVPPNRRNDSMERTTHPQVEVKPVTPPPAHTEAYKPPPAPTPLPPAQTEAYKPPPQPAKVTPPPPARTEAYKPPPPPPPAHVAPSQPAQVQPQPEHGQPPKPAAKPPAKEEHDRKKTTEH